MYKLLVPMLLLIIVIITTTATAQHPPDTLWTNTYVYGWESFGYCARQTEDGGFILTGLNKENGSLYADVYLVKTGPDGNVLWSQNYGGLLTDQGFDVKQTDDGGYIIVGYTSSFSAYADVYLIKTDADGDTIWTRTFESELSCIGASVTQTFDGGYIVTGHTDYTPNINRIILLRYDMNGDTVWTRIYSDFDAKGNSVIQLEDGCFIVTGQIDLGDADVFLMKTDEDGHILWMQTYGGPQTDSGSCVRQTYDGGFIIAGSYKFNNYNTDFYLIKTDSVGDTLWTRSYGGDSKDYSYCVDQTFDGGYFLTGRTHSFGAVNGDVYVVRTDSQGDTVWTNNYGSGSVEKGQYGQQTSDGGYIICGYTTDTPGGYYNAWLIRLESEFATPDVSITLEPIGTPIQIPTIGGSFDFNIRVLNNEITPVTFRAWTDVTLPDSSIYGHIIGLRELTLPGGGFIDRRRTQVVPVNAPAGMYNYNAYVGDSLGNVWDEDHFEFEKLTIGDGEVIRDWVSYGEEFTTQFEGDSRIAPTEYAISGAFPNPFNPTTAISYQLSAVSHVNLKVYDVSGREVAELVNGWREAGMHEVTFDGTNLASGIYLYYLQVGEFEASDKMVLMK